MTEKTAIPSHPDSNPGHFDSKKKRLSWLPILLSVSLFFIASPLGKLANTMLDVPRDKVAQSLERALIATAVIMAVDAGISVLQTSELSIGFFVVEGSLELGQILDPINDMLEFTTKIMWFITASWVVQKILVSFDISVLLSGIIYIIAALWLSIISIEQWRYCIPDVIATWLHPKLAWLLRATLLVIFPVIFIPLVVVASTSTHQWFSTSEYVEDSIGELKEFSSLPTVKITKGVIESLKNKSREIFKYMTNIIVAFLFEVVISSLLFLVLICFYWKAVTRWLL